MANMGWSSLLSQTPRTKCWCERPIWTLDRPCVGSSHDHQYIASLPEVG